MASQTLFTFSTPSSFSPLTAAPHHVPGGSASHQAMTQKTLLGLEEMMKKWGMLHKGKHVLHRFVYQMEQPTTPYQSSGVDVVDHTGSSGATTTSTAAAAASSSLSSRRHFHSGLAADFLRCFFASEAVQKACGEVFPFSAHHHISGAVPDYRELRCSWTSLQPFERLAAHKVIRKGREENDVEDEDRLNEAEAWSRAMTRKSGDSSDAGLGARDAVSVLTRGESRMPIVKRPEKFIRGDVIVADELRALFLDTFSRPQEQVAFYAAQAEDVEEDANEDFFGDEDDDEDGFGYYTSYETLSRRQRAEIFSHEERQELLYHILWRLVAGGGAMNQFEDDFAVYKAATRALFRTLVTSIRVTAEQRDEDDDDLENNKDKDDEHDDDAPLTVYVPRVQSFVFQILRLSAPPQQGGGVMDDHCEATALWSASDGMSPSNLNYCYVIVNPLQQEVVLWYHSC